MQIQVLSSTTTTQQGAKGPYQMVEVAYKNLTFQGKVEAKKLMPFGANKSAFEVLALAKPTEVFEVEVSKNQQGYNDWVKVTKGTAQGTTVSSSEPVRTAGGTTATKGGWETPEERAKRQIYIVRQSSLSSAIATLTVARKSEVKPQEVIDLARAYESFVFGSDTAEVVKQDVGGIEEITEDVPW